MDMERSMTQSKLKKELAGATDKLTADRMTPAKRLDLLRKQAELVDIREDREKAARRLV
jgi:hypothetical protein